LFFFFSSRRRHTRSLCDWSSDVCSSDLRKWGEDEEMYAVIGLLHDLDYERYPDLDTGHPRKALELFRERGYPQVLIDAVAGHATFLGVPRETRMAKTLYAV